MIKIMLATLLIISTYQHNIQSFGAIPHSDTIDAQVKNSKALVAAILAANSSSTDRIVKIQSKTYYAMPISVKDIHNISIMILGRWSASKSIKDWPGSYDDFMYFTECSKIQMKGGGRIDGRGYHWWIVTWLNLIKDSRPHLISFERSSQISIHDLILKNSPSFHLRSHQLINSTFYNLNIKVNTTAQFNLLKRFSMVGILPTFPLNTDGIDPAGKDIHIYNITCQNYDDVVVPKPSHHSSNFTNCTENLMIENITVRLGVGMSIGSVPPNSEINCVRNITFRNVQMDRPFKGIYVKTNPGNSGSGLVENILYQNVTMDRPIWWAIYLGPQQQKQPDGGGPGCMIYPFDPKGNCQTQPRVTIKNVTLKNVRIHKSLLFPIILRCNQSNPCHQINFDDVKIDSWIIGGKFKDGYVCQYVSGYQKNNHPKVSCLSDKSQNQQQIVKQLNEETSQQDENISQRKLAQLLFKQLQSASNEIPYEDIDDEMELTQEYEKLYQLIQ